MNHFYHSAFLEALGWSLIDSLWQMGIVWLGYVVVTGNGKKSNASSRYRLAVLAIVSGCLWFGTSLFLNYYHLNDGGRVFGLVHLLRDALPAMDEQKWIPLISSFYLLIVLVYACGWVCSLVGNQHRFVDRRPISDKYYESFVAELKHVTGIRRDVRIWVSEHITSPITFGFIKPVILLPVAALTQLSVKQVEAMIVHELHHIRRNDYLANLLMSLCEIILFFNPFARLLIADAIKERENCCDDEVINLGYDRWEYAHALYLLGKTSVEKYGFALAATGDGKHMLLQRVRRMLNRGCSSRPLLTPVTVFFLCLILAGSISRDLNKAGAKHPATIIKVEHMVSLVTEEKTMLPQVPDPVKPERKSGKPVQPPPPPPATILEDEHPNPNPENIIVASYVSSEAETIEFSMIEAQMSETQSCDNSENCDDSHPYIPGTTFYYPAHQMSSVENGRTTVHL